MLLLSPCCLRRKQTPNKPQNSHTCFQQVRPEGSCQPGNGEENHFWTFSCWELSAFYGGEEAWWELMQLCSWAAGHPLPLAKRR